MNNRILEFEACLASIPQEPYPKHSRIHPIRSLSNHSHCYVKRDDELGFGITGSKLRKYRSLIPFFRENKIKEVAVIGSAYSNNVLGITQLLIENEIKPTLFLKQPLHKEKKGIFLLTHLFVDERNIHFIPAESWKNVEKIAKEYSEINGCDSTFILKEGASVKESLPGALSLSSDILKNEIENNIFFDHIFIESGTGLMACALILAFSSFFRKSTIHVVLLAEDENYFLKQLNFFYEKFQELMRISIPFPKNFELHKSKTAAAFGSTNKKIFNEIRSIAKFEGFLLDPIYSAKLFLTTREILSENKFNNKTSLVIHSGGGLSLMGFQENLLKDD